MSWPPDFENIALRYQTCNDFAEDVAVVNEAAAGNIETALRHHVAIRLHTVLNNLNSSKSYKIIIGGGRAAELYIHPVLQNILYQKGLYEFSYDFDLVAYQNTSPANHIWNPWGDFSATEDWNQENHPALNDLLGAIRAQYQNDFVRRELISHLRNIDKQNLYDFALLDNSLTDGTAFWKQTFIPAAKPYTRIWQIHFGIPFRASVKVPDTAFQWKGRYYISMELLDLKNAIRSDYLYSPGGVIQDDKGKISLQGYPKSAFLRGYFWEKWQRSDSDAISIQVREGTNLLVVDPYVLYKEQGHLIGEPAVRREILGAAEYAKLDKELRSLGLTLPDGVSQFDLPQKAGLAARPEKYKKRLVRLYCLFTMISQLQRLESDGSYVAKLGGATMTIPIRNYFVFFSMVPFHRNNWRFKKSTDAENVKAFSKGYAGYPFLKIAFDNDLINWYAINQGEDKLTDQAWSTALMKSYNMELGKAQKYCSNVATLSAVIVPTTGISYQAHINTWIVASDAWRRSFHTAVYQYIELKNNSRRLFFSGLYAYGNGLLQAHANFINNTLHASYLPSSAPINKNLQIITYRFGYPMNVLYKQSPSIAARLGLVDTLPLNHVVYTAAYLSTTMKNSGTLNLDSYRNVLTTGHTLYEFELIGDGFLYFTYDFSTSQLKNEHEVFIPVWTKFYVKSKQWKYIADINLAQGDTQKNYKLVLVVRLAQIPETKAKLLEDIEGDQYIKPPAKAQVGLPKKVAPPPLPSAKGALISAKPAAPLVPALPAAGTAIPPGYNFANASADTGIPFETAYTPALQLDHTLAGNPILDPDTGLAFFPNEIDQWIDANFPYADGLQQATTTQFIYETNNSFFGYLGNSAHDGSEFPLIFPNEFGGKEPEIANTEGDGSCLVHAILVCLSRRYRYHPNKRIVGRAYRQHQMIKFARTFGDLRNFMVLDYWLRDDRHLQPFLDKHNLNLMMHVFTEGMFSLTASPHTFEGYPYDNAHLKKPGRPAIIILNEGNYHFSACKYRNNAYPLRPQDIITIANLLSYVEQGFNPGPHQYPAIKAIQGVPGPVAVGNAASWAAPSGPVLSSSSVGPLILFEAGGDLGKKVINRKATDEELAEIQKEFIKYRVNFEAKLSGNFPIVYGNRNLDGFFCWVAHSQNNFIHTIQTTFSAALNVTILSDDNEYIIGAKTLILQIKRELDALPYWDTSQGQTLAKFSALYAFCKKCFFWTTAPNFLEDVITSLNIVFPSEERRMRWYEGVKYHLEKDPHVARFGSFNTLIQMYLILEMMKALSYALQSTPGVAKFPLPPNDIPEAVALRQYDLGAITFDDKKIGYRFPVFEKLAKGLIDQTAHFPLWNEHISVYLKAYIALNVFGTQSGGKRKTRRKSRHASHKTRKH